MILSFILWLVAWRIRLKLFFALKNNLALQQELSLENFSLLVCTTDKRVQRSYIWQSGKFSSFPHIGGEPNISVIFPDTKKDYFIYRLTRPGMHSKCHILW